MSPRPRVRLQELLLLGASLLFALVLAEAVLPHLRPFEEERRRYMRARNVFQYDERNVRFDPELGFFQRPGLSVPFSNREYRTRVQTDSRGFRDDEESLRHPRLLVLGDSFAFGWGVEARQTYEEILQRSLGVSALNMGVPGYGTTQEYLVLRRWAEEHRDSMTGCIAVIQFYGNDIPAIDKDPGDVFPALEEGPAGPVFRPVTEKEYELQQARVRGAMSGALVRHSFVADMCVQLWLRARSKVERMRASHGERAAVSPERESPADPEQTVAGRSDVAAAAGAESGTAAGPQPGMSAAHPKVLAILRAIRALADQDSFRVLFVYVPSVRYYEGSPAYDAQALGVLDPALREAGIPLCDLRGDLTRADYYKYDDHWRPSGHEKAARAIAAWLEANHWIRSGGPAGAATSAAAGAAGSDGQTASAAGAAPLQSRFPRAGPRGGP